MKFALQILLVVAGVFFFLLCPFGCQPNEGNVLLPNGAVPFPYGADDKHLYVVQPDPDRTDYDTYARSNVRRDHAKSFLQEYGFKKVTDPGVTGRPAAPAQIQSWWTLAKHPQAEKWTKPYPDSGYADAYLVNDELFLYATGNYRAISIKDRAFARWMARAATL